MEALRKALLELIDKNRFVITGVIFNDSLGYERIEILGYSLIMKDFHGKKCEAEVKKDE